MQGFILENADKFICTKQFFFKTEKQFIVDTFIIFNKK